MVDVKVVATASPAPAWSLRSTRVRFIIGPLLHLFLKEIRSDGLDVTIPNLWRPNLWRPSSEIPEPWLGQCLAAIAYVYLRDCGAARQTIALDLESRAGFA